MILRLGLSAKAQEIQCYKCKVTMTFVSFPAEVTDRYVSKNDCVNNQRNKSCIRRDLIKGRVK